MTHTPPPAIGTFKLLKFVDACAPVVFTRKQRIFSDGKLLGAVPRLTICKSISNDTFALFLCDANWDVIAIAKDGSLDGLMETAERWYEGLNWIDAPFSEDEYKAYILHNHSDTRCSFCRKWAWEYTTMFSQNDCNICDACVRKFFSCLPDTERAVDS